MQKIITTEKYIKRFFTKCQIRFIKDKGWNFITESMLPEGCKFKRAQLCRSDIKELTIFSNKQSTALEKAVVKRVKTLLAKMPEDLETYYKELDAKVSAAKRAEAKAHKIENEISEMLNAHGLHGVFSAISHLRIGEHTDRFTAVYSNYNAIICDEHKDYDGYSRRCSFPLVTRSFTLHIRKGFHLVYIGGLLTFVRGDKIDRNGMACEWIEQGKSIADIRTVRGFLVRGEHIKAKNLTEAKSINAEHRAIMLARLITSRKKAQKRAEQMANGTLRITLQDSINAGNCLYGTLGFKHKYEDAIGHEANDISIADLRKYASMFGVQSYAERAIVYALSH